MGNGETLPVKAISIKVVAARTFTHTHAHTRTERNDWYSTEVMQHLKKNDWHLGAAAELMQHLKLIAKLPGKLHFYDGKIEN